MLSCALIIIKALFCLQAFCAIASSPWETHVTFEAQGAGHADLHVQRALNIALAVPCIGHHLHFLAGLFDDIAHQTVRPVVVVVALSSLEETDDDGENAVRSLFEHAFVKSKMSSQHDFQPWSSPSHSPSVPNLIRDSSPSPSLSGSRSREPKRLPHLVVVATKASRSHAQNRNVALATAAALQRKTTAGLTTDSPAIDVVSFIDADDRMHPRRIEWIGRCLAATGANALLHGFVLAKSDAERPEQGTVWNSSSSRTKRTEKGGGEGGEDEGTRQHDRRHYLHGNGEPHRCPECTQHWEEEEEEEEEEDLISASSSSRSSSPSSRREHRSPSSFLQRECGRGLMLAQSLLGVYAPPAQTSPRMKHHQHGHGDMGEGGVAPESPNLSPPADGGVVTNDAAADAWCPAHTSNKTTSGNRSMAVERVLRALDEALPPPMKICCQPCCPPARPHSCSSDNSNNNDNDSCWCSGGDGESDSSACSPPTTRSFLPHHGHISLRLRARSQGVANCTVGGEEEVQEREGGDISSSSSSASTTQAGVDREAAAAAVAARAAVGAAWHPGPGPGGSGEDVAFVKALLRAGVVAAANRDARKSCSPTHRYRLQSLNSGGGGGCGGCDGAVSAAFASPCSQGDGPSDLVDPLTLAFMPERRLSLYLPGSARRCVTRTTMFLDCAVDVARATLSFSGTLALSPPCPEGTAPGLTAHELRSLVRPDLAAGALHARGRREGAGAGREAGEGGGDGSATSEYKAMCVPVHELADLGIVYFDSGVLA